VKRSEQLDERRSWMMRVEPAGVREEPDLRRADAFILEAAHSLGVVECRAVGAQSDDRKNLWPESANFAVQKPGSLE